MFLPFYKRFFLAVLHSIPSQIIFIFICSALLGCWFMPELWVTHSMSFLNNNLLTRYAGAFTLTNFIYQGGIQLWDAYDQMPLNFLEGTLGLYKLSNIVVAGIFGVLALVSDDPGRLFHAVFSYGYFGVYLLIQTIGGVLLLNRFCRRFWILFVSVLWMNAFWFSFVLIRGDEFQCFVPFLMHLILKIRERFRWKDVVLFLVLWGILSRESVLIAGYVYLEIHFFILAVTGNALWVNRKILLVRMKEWVSLILKSPGRESKGHLLTVRLGKKIPALLWICGTGLFLMCLFLPSVYVGWDRFSDFALQSGNRTRSPFSLQSYFGHPGAGFPLGMFVEKMVDFTSQGEWLFLGWSLVVLALVGCFFSPDPRRHFFAAGFCFIVLLNLPKESLPVGFLVHFFNALTNPFKFMSNAFGELATIVIPFYLVPLAAMGLSVIWGMKKFLAVFLVSLTGLFILALASGQGSSRIYCVLVLLMGGLSLFFFMRKTRLRLNSALLAVFVLLILVDWFLLRHKSRLFMDNNRIHPYTLEEKDHENFVGMDFHNPKITPFRRFFEFKNFGLHQNHFLLQDPNNMPGLIFQYTNFYRNLLVLNDYIPRHKSFSSWRASPDLWIEYCDDDHRMIFDVTAAVDARAVSLKDVVAQDLRRWVVVVHDQDRTLNLDQKLPDRGLPLSNVVVKLDGLALWIDTRGVISMDYGYDIFKKINIQNGVVKYSVNLPREFPLDVASTFLTDDSQVLNVFVQKERNKERRKLRPVQGEIIQPWTYDINNIRSGWMTLGLPLDDFPSNEKIVLSYPSVKQNGGLSKIISFQWDRLAFRYKLDRDGWMVIHYPFDPKWKVIVDNQPAKVFRVNESFIGFPLKQGEHEIVLSYWPKSWLRWSIWLSIILTILGFGWVVREALRDEFSKPGKTM